MSVRSSSSSAQGERASSPGATGAWCGWIKRVNATGGDENILTLDSKKYLQIDSGGHLELFTNQNDVGTNVLSVGTWYFVAYNFAAGVNDVFLNGGLTAEISHSEFDTPDGSRLQFFNDDFGDYFDGEVRDYRLWTVNLTAAEFVLEMASSTRVKTANAWDRYQMVNAAGAATSDLGTHNLTVAGLTNGASDPTIYAGGSSQSLTGAAIGTDEKINAGAITTSIGLTGQNIPTQEKENAGAVTMSISLAGNFISTAEIESAGSVAVGAVTLTGSNSKTDEAAYAGLASLGATIVTGSTASTDEKENTGSFNIPTAPIAGAFSATDQSIATATVSPGAVALTGTASGTDEKESAGSVAAVINLPGAAIASDEAERAGTATPGARALSGVFSSTDESVNRGDLNGLPFTAIWTQVASSHLATVIPSPVPTPGGSAYQNVIADYSGGAADLVNSVAYIWGGGHTGYAGNEVYAFDMVGLAWARKSNPTSNAILSDATNDTIDTSGYNETAVGSGTPDTSQPRARHTSNHIQFTNSHLYAPFTVAVYPSANGSAAANYFNPSTGVWAPRTANPSGVFAYDGVTAVDPATGHIWWYKGGGAPGTYLTEYRPLTDDWVTHGDDFVDPWPPAVAGDHYLTAVIVNGKMWCFGQGHAGYFDLSASSPIQFVPVTTTGPQDIQGAVSPGITIHTPSGYIIGWSGGTDVFAFDTTTLTWTKINLNGSSAVTPTAAAVNGTYGRFRYFPGVDKFFAVNSTEENVFILALPGGQQSLSGQACNTDERESAGTVTTAISLAGAASKTDEVIGQSAVSTLIAISGTASATDERESVGTLAAGGLSLVGQAVTTDEAARVGALAAVINLPGAAIATDEVSRTGAIAASISLAGQTVTTEEKENAGSVLSVITLSGASTVTDERESAGVVAVGGVSLSGTNSKTDEADGAGTVQSGTSVTGQAITTDEKESAGTVTPGAIAIAGATTTTDEAERAGSVAAAYAIAGQTSATDEAARAGTAAAGSVNLAGASSSTDELATTSTVTPGSVSLAGTFETTDEQEFPGTVLVNTKTLNGVAITTDETQAQGTVAAGAVALAGSRAATDESETAGGVTSAIGLAGQAVRTDEAARAGTAAASISLSGDMVPTQEKVNASTLATGGVSITGTTSTTDEAARAGAVGAAATPISGSTTTTDERSGSGTATPGPASVIGQHIDPDENVRSNTVTPGGIGILGMFFRGDEDSASGALALTYLLHAQGIATDEQLRQAVLTVGVRNLVGAFAYSTETIYRSRLVNPPVDHLPLSTYMATADQYLTKAQAADGFLTKVQIMEGFL